MIELKPTEKGYIDTLAKENSKKEYRGFVFEEAVNDFTTGYTLALEHNNVPELIEAAKALFEDVLSSGYASEARLLKAVTLKNEVTKAEQNKLNK